MHDSTLRIGQVAVSSCVLGLLLACAPLHNADSTDKVLAATPVPERDIKVAMQALAGATILETDRYIPRVPLHTCGARPLQVGSNDLSGELAKAIYAAQAYHEKAQGVGLIILQNGSIVHEDYTDPATAASQTESASMMKSVLGLLTGIAIEKGAIGSIDDRIGKYLAEWQDDPRGDITIRQLLTMSTGLGKSDFVRILMSSDISAAALESVLTGEPGNEFAYNNAVSQLLGTLVDRQVRTIGYDDFRDFLQRELWCPLGNDEAALWFDREGGSPRYYAGLQANLSDWARIGELIRNDGMVGSKRVVPMEWIAQMKIPSQANAQYGLHLWLGGAWSEQRAYAAGNPVTVPQSAPFAAEDVVFFDGFGGQRVYVAPSIGLTIARTGYTNLSYDDAIIVNLLSNAMSSE
ncbi:MAG: serine hydrolase [Erythrobacter sp.]